MQLGLITAKWTGFRTKTDYPWHNCQRANISRVCKATGLKPRLGSASAHSPHSFPITPELVQNDGAKCVLPRSQKAGTICCNPPCARGDGTGHIACEIARLLVYSTTWSRHLDPGRRGKAPSGAQNRTSVEMAQGHGSEQIGLAACIMSCRVVLCRVLYTTGRLVPTHPILR